MATLIKDILLVIGLPKDRGAIVHPVIPDVFAVYNGQLKDIRVQLLFLESCVSYGLCQLCTAFSLSFL